MSRRSPTRFLMGLVVEVTAVVLGVSLLPKLPWKNVAGAAAEAQLADQRPTLAHPPAESGTFGHSPADASRIAFTTTTQLPAQDQLPVDPAYVERRLDQTGQKLLHGVSSYLRRTADEMLHPQPLAPAGSFAPPGNAYRY